MVDWTFRGVFTKTMTLNRTYEIYVGCSLLGGNLKGVLMTVGKVMKMIVRQ